MIKLFLIILCLTTIPPSQASDSGDWSSGQYFSIEPNSAGVKELIDPLGETFYFRGVVYAPLEGQCPDFYNNVYTYLRNKDWECKTGVTVGVNKDVAFLCF